MPRVMVVSMKPGQRALTVTCERANSFAAVRLRPTPPAVAIMRVLHDGVALGRVRHIQTNTDAGRPQTRRHGRGVCLIDIGAYDNRAVLSQLAGDSLADAAAGARNNCDFVFQQVSR